MKRIILELTRTLNKFIQKKELKGYYFKVKGRFQRGRRKATIIKKRGALSFVKVDSKLKVKYGLLYTRFGVAGIKVIFSY